MSVAAQLPDLSAEYRLSPEQCEAYRRDGHICLRGVCTAEEAAVYREVTTDAVMRHNKETRKLEDRDTYGKAFLQIMNLWTDEEACRHFVLAKRFAQIAADLMGVDGIRLYHDQALYKEGGGGFTPWHQDEYYWPLATDSTITMWMPLVDVDETMGVMSFASGSHKGGYLGEMKISDESEKHFSRFVKERGFTLTSPGKMKAGDATFHSGWTLHSAPGNQTDRTREVMTVIYFADGTRVSHPDHIHRQNDLRAWLPGCAPGDRAASHLNPLLYSRRQSAG